MLNKRQVIAITSGLFLVASSAQGANPDDVLRVDYGTSDVVFQPNVHGQGVTLTISCAGDTYLRQFYPGTAPVSFSLIDQDGLPIQDGLCKYEVRIHPILDNATAEASAGSNGEREAERLGQVEEMQTIVASGAFMIEAGQIIVQPPRADDDDSAYDAQPVGE